MLASFRKTIFLAALLFVVMAFQPPPKFTVHLIGDSTMATKRIAMYPQAGWGMPFQYFFDSSVTVANHAAGGTSTRTFMSQGRWEKALTALGEGDYVFIQFGHNDEGKLKPSYTTPDEFKQNLRKYVTDSRSKKALPILITPVSRRIFDSAGRITETHKVYSALVKEVAAELSVPLIDLDTKSRDLYQSFGEENSKFLFNHLAKGEHPNYPDGVEDNTHFSELGARKIAQLILEEVKRLNLPLAAFVVKPVAKPLAAPATAK